MAAHDLNWVEISIQLGDEVRARREAKDWTQEKLAEEAGISRNQVQNIERSRNNQRDPATRLPGPGNPRLQTLFRIAIALEVDPWVLVQEAAKTTR